VGYLVRERLSVHDQQHAADVPDADRHVDSDADRHADSDADRHADSDADRHADPDADIHNDRYRNADP